MNKLKNFLVRLYLKYDRFRQSFFSKSYKENKAKIQKTGSSVPSSQDAEKSDELQKQLFLFSSFRVNSPLRQSILETTVPRTLKGLGGSSLDLWVLDASPDEFVEGNRKSFESVLGLNMGYYPKKVRLQDAYISVLKEAQQPYFATIYDDQPIYGLSADFYSAACQLLKDFKSTVDLVLIEMPTKINIDHANKTVTYDPESLDFKNHGEKPVAMVRYGGYNFAILHNFHYGFFFNTIIADKKVYAEKLKWYMENVSSTNPQHIELAGLRRKGPVYDFIAVPLQAASFNIDCSHSDISIREVDKETEDLYKALKEGYVLSSGK